MEKQIILSGIQPTGKLHLGNYLGAVKNFVELQNHHHCYFMVADLHSLTANYDPATKQAQILETAKEYLAAGLDPKKCHIFIQSYVPQHTELAWVFNTLTPMAFLERMTQFKDKAAAQKTNINTGLFTYPTLMAADILIYKATAVPVGIDQEQHLELTRQIAKFFNNKFSQTFPEPKSLKTEIPKVMSLLEPNKKMAKSLGDNHCIYLDDEPETIAKKLSKAVTDTGDGKSNGAHNLLDLLKTFSAPEVYAKFVNEQKSGAIRYSELKAQLATDIAAHFSGFRETKKKLKDGAVKKILDKGAKAANKVASATMKEVRVKIGIR